MRKKKKKERKEKEEKEKRKGRTLPAMGGCPQPTFPFASLLLFGRYMLPWKERRCGQAGHTLCGCGEKRAASEEERGSALVFGRMSHSIPERGWAGPG